MRKSLKYLIMTRLLLVTGVMLVSFAALAYVSLQNISEANISRHYNDSATEVFSQMNSTLENVYQMGQSLSADERVRSFLRSGDFTRPAHEVKAVTELVRSLNNITILQPYVHSFCIVNSEGKIYWNQSPFDDFFYKWFEEKALDGGSILDTVGFIPAYEFPGTTQTQKCTLISCVTDIYEYGNEKFKPSGKIIMNVDMDILMKDLFHTSDVIESIGLWDEAGDCLYSRNRKGLWENFLPEEVQWNTQTVQKYGGDYISARLLKDVKWLSAMRFSEIHTGIFSNRVFIGMALVITVLGIGMILILVFPLLNRISRQIKALEGAMHQFADGNMEVELNLSGSVEMENISRGFRYMEVKSKEFMDEALENEKAKQQVAFELLLAKINPHFIYNTLNSVIYLARQKKHDAVIQLTGAFIYLLQDSIHLGTNSLYEKLDVEFEVIDKYILIQRYRYMDMFAFESEKGPGLEDVFIPKNILQPLIENAILHGICPVEDGRECKIVLSARKEDDMLAIEIRDNGVGFEEGQIEKLLNARDEDAAGKGRSKLRPIGIGNIAEKLKLVYGGQHSLSINSEPDKGTVIEIHIPIIVNVK